MRIPVTVVLHKMKIRYLLFVSLSRAVVYLISRGRSVALYEGGLWD